MASEYLFSIDTCGVRCQRRRWPEQCHQTLITPRPSIIPHPTAMLTPPPLQLLTPNITTGRRTSDPPNLFLLDASHNAPSFGPFPTSSSLILTQCIAPFLQL